MKKCLFLILVIGLSLNGMAQQDSVWTLKLKEVIVEDENGNNLQSKVLKDEIQRIRPHDIGEVFADQPGFGVIKRGSFAMEPVLRSFKYDQLNIRYNASAVVKNACPSRMDPVTVHITPEELERIEIIKGPYSVRYGQTFGGIINLVNTSPKFTAKPKLSGLFESGYETNGQGKYGSIQLNPSMKKISLNLAANWKSYDNYVSGSGTEIASSFNTASYKVQLGLRPAKNQILQLGFRQNFVTDVLHAGLPMDADADLSSIFDLSYNWETSIPFVNSVSLKAYFSDVDHIMSNSLRPNYAKVHAESIVDSSTGGAKLEAELPVLNGKLYVGIDYNNVAKDGARTREVITNPCTGVTPPEPLLFTDLIWQDSYSETYGLYGEWNGKLGEKTFLTGGIRFDEFKSNSNDPANDFAAMYENELEGETSIQMSGGLSLKYRLTDKSEVKVAVGKGIRNADLLERYVNHFTVGMDAYEYVGNPNLKPEQNYQVDVSYNFQGDKAGYAFNAFYSYVTDYITAIVDTTLERKFLACQEPKHAKRFVNAEEVTQTGVELMVQYKLTKSWKLMGDFSYVYAQNLEWNEPLAEIPPLSSHLTLQFNKKKLKTDLTWKIVAGQDRVSNAFNESTSEAFQLLDFHIKYDPWKFMTAYLSVTNLLDANYYEHLSRPYRNMSSASMYFEPGRSVNIGVRLRF